MQIVLVTWPTDRRASTYRLWLQSGSFLAAEISYLFLLVGRLKQMMGGMLSQLHLHRPSLLGTGRFLAGALAALVAMSSCVLGSPSSVCDAANLRAPFSFNNGIPHILSISLTPCSYSP